MTPQTYIRDDETVVEEDRSNAMPWLLTLLIIPLFFFLGWEAKSYFEPYTGVQFGVGAGPDIATVCPTVTPDTFTTPEAIPTTGISGPTGVTGATGSGF